MRITARPRSLHDAFHAKGIGIVGVQAARIKAPGFFADHQFLAVNGGTDSSSHGCQNWLGADLEVSTADTAVRHASPRILLASARAARLWSDICVAHAVSQMVPDDELDA